MVTDIMSAAWNRLQWEYVYHGSQETLQIRVFPAPSRAPFQKAAGIPLGWPACQSLRRWSSLSGGQKQQLTGDMGSETAGPRCGGDQVFTACLPSVMESHWLPLLTVWVFPGAFKGRTRERGSLALGAGVWNLSWEGRHVKTVGTGGWR